MSPWAPQPSPQRANEPSADHARALESLLELGCEMGSSLDLYETADLLLFNLMGQFGASRAALWMLGRDGAAPVLVRAHGFTRDGLRGVALDGLPRRCATTRSPLPAAWAFEGDTSLAARAAGIEVVGPVHGRGELLGWIALGPHVTGAPWVEAELRVIEAALGMAGMALQTARLHGETLEQNRRLSSVNEQLEEAARLKAEFLSNVSHELRTPLTVVLGSLDCVLDARPPAEITERMLTAARTRAHDLQRLLERVLTFSSAVDGTLAARLEPLDVGAFLDAFHARRRPGVRAAFHPLAYERPVALPSLPLDPQHLRWILDELFDNALKFTPSGAALRLQARVDAGDRVPALEIVVADEGPGVTAEQLATLFDPFEQVDGSNTRTVGGLGMGLALARRLAEGMRGTLEAASAPGAGCTFTLRLPVD
jgi:signal transduction histidine kinase